MMRKSLVFTNTVKCLRKNKYGSQLIRNYNVLTEDNIFKSPYKDVEVPNMTVYDYVWQNLDKWPQRTVAVCSQTGRGYTYEQAFKLSNTFAANIRKKLKIQDGDAVAVMLPNVPDYPLVIMGILEAGGFATTLNPVYTAHEIQRQLVMSNAKVIVTIPELVGTVRNAFKLAKIDIPIIAVRTNGESVPAGTILFSELTEDPNVDKSCLKEVRRTPKDICILPYSSGTTGLPKGVELTNRNIVANCEQMNEEAVKCHTETTANHQDSCLVVLPMFHIYAISVIMFHKMSHGIKLVTVPKFSPDHYIKTIEKYKTNVLFVAPPLIFLKAAHPAVTPAGFAHVETIINGAAAMSEADADRLMTKLGREIDFRQGYGLTETSPVISMTPKALKNYGCVGAPLPNTDVKIVDDKLNTVGINQKGELLARGPQVMKGYYNNSEANAEAFADGWFRTGDLAYISEDGVIYIADRLKELIKVKGFQVPPAELEAVLRAHPSVADAAVLGVPHPAHGETPKAFLVAKTKDVDVNDIKRFVSERVAPYKQINDIVFIDQIPKSQAGKILRRVLKVKYC